MSLIKLGILLPKAFERIDRSNAIREKQNTKSAEEILKNILPKTQTPYSIEVRGGVLTIFSSSQILKQRVHTSEKEIVKEIKQKFPSIIISQIRFKGPR